jgi:hypothetical protein
MASNFEGSQSPPRAVEVRKKNQFFGSRTRRFSTANTKALIKRVREAVTSSFIFTTCFYSIDFNVILKFFFSVLETAFHDLFPYDSACISCVHHSNNMPSSANRERLDFPVLPTLRNLFGLYH